MRFFVITSAVALFGSLSCAKKEEAPKGVASAEGAGSISASGADAMKLAAVAPRIGGKVIVIGDHAVELVLNQSGAVEALVSNAMGELVTEGVKLALTARVNGDAKEEVNLAFEKPRGRFEGRCRGKLASGPVDVALEVKGQAAAGKLVESVLVRGPELGGSLLVAGDHGAEVLVRSSGEVLAFVRDRNGVDVRGDAALDVKAKVQAVGGGRAELSLVFEEPRACFAGKARGGVELTPGPIELAIGAKTNMSFGRLENVALLAEASHGGEVIMVGDYSAELVLDAKSISAFVYDASAKASADANLDVKLDLGADARSSLALAWEATCLCYRGALSAGLRADVEPLRLRITAGGRAFVGAAASLRAVVDSRLRAAAKLAANADVKAKVGADAKAVADTKAKLGGAAKAGVGVAKTAGASAKMGVAAPKVTAKKSASADAKSGGKAKASAGFSLGAK